MKLCIRLDLPDPRGTLKLETEGTDADGEARKEVPLPFDESESSIVARALDINANPELKRHFSAEELCILRGWGVLCEAPPKDKSVILSANDLHREKLRNLAQLWPFENKNLFLSNT